MSSHSPSRDGYATALCPVCEGSFAPSPNRRYCSLACRATAWRRRHQTPAPPPVVPAARSQREHTVYECEACGTRSLGEQRCEGCGLFMRRVGLGGRCPHCDDPVAVVDLIDEVVLPLG